jgi:hypothetical protein
MANVLVIHIVQQKVSETILRVGLDITWHVLPQCFVCDVLEISRCSMFVRRAGANVPRSVVPRHVLIFGEEINIIHLTTLANCLIATFFHLA